MNRYVSFFLLIIFIASLAFLHFKDEGIINILWLGYEVTLSVITGIVVLFVAFLGYRYINIFFRWLAKLSSVWKSFFDRFKKGKTSQDELFTLALTSLETSLWEDARAYLMILLQKNPTPKVYNLLAILELQEHNDSQAAMSWLQKGMMYRENSAAIM